jgi:hypothetical protein
MLDWLPNGKKAAVCLTIDDVHPGKSTDAYEAGGDLGKGSLGHLEWLLERHPKLKATLFVTADWREISPRPTKKLLAGIPFIRDKFYLTEILPKGTMRLINHPAFVRYLRNLPRTEIAFHGLHHVHRGKQIPVEFQDQTIAECQDILTEMVKIFLEVNLPFVQGMNPPGWNLPDNLALGMIATGLKFAASARDIQTPIAKFAKTNMTGLKGVSLIYPELIFNGKLIHFTSNFQATNHIERAIEIIENGGLLAIKVHIVKNAMGHIALDGLDESYRNYLDSIFNKLENLYGDSLWWTSMGEITKYLETKNVEC